MKKALQLALILSILPSALVAQKSLRSFERAFPFGSPALTDSTFDVWDTSEPSDSVRQTTLLEVVRYYCDENAGPLDSEGTIKALPPVKDYRIVKTNSFTRQFDEGVSHYEFRSIKADSVKAYHYRLPDMGELQVYYYGEAGDKGCRLVNETEDLTCELHGLLLFYHPGNKTLDILPALEMHSDKDARRFRFHFEVGNGIEQQQRTY